MPSPPLRPIKTPAGGRVGALAYAVFGHGHIIGVELNADEAAPFLNTHLAYRAGAAKRIEDKAARRASGEDAGPDKIRRKGRKMRF